MAGEAEVREMLETIEVECRLTSTMTGIKAFRQSVMEAMARVPRERFVPERLKPCAYYNGPLPIGHGQTISQPYIVALMTDLLLPEQDQVILEVGTGSGYQTAILAELVRQVYSLEIIPDLSAQARDRLHELGYENVEILAGDGYHGWFEHAPFDAIIVTAAARAIPSPLVEQLRNGGRLVIPVGPPHGFQYLKLVEKDERGAVSERGILGVSFVPLTRDGHE